MEQLTNSDTPCPCPDDYMDVRAIPFSQSNHLDWLCYTVAYKSLLVFFAL